MRFRRVVTLSAVAVAGSFLMVSALPAIGHAEDGKPLYDKNCASCHGPAGKGDGPAAKVLKPPPQDFAVALKGKSDADIAKVVKEGGKAVGKAATMPAYASKLSDDQIQAVAQYVKGLAK